MNEDDSSSKTPRSLVGNAGTAVPTGTPVRDRLETSPGHLSTRRRSTATQNVDQERVKVVVRVRPPNTMETGGVIELIGNGMVIHRERTTAARSPFEFDQVLGPSSTQADVYEAAVQGLVADVLDGYNATVMAYGPTGAGKTHTLSSIHAEAIGMIPRAGMEIFQRAGTDTQHDYEITLSYIQVYQETIQDLLAPEHENLQLREGPSGVYVEGVREERVADIESCLQHLQIGDRNRIFAFTRLNAHSSRSHAIVMFTVVRREKPLPGALPLLPANTVRVGRLFMVDLAGSERLKKSGSLGIRADEAKAINLSLTMLGMCINARADPTATHVPFRDSKLTRLLQESLGGNAKTSLVVAVADAREQVEETLQALQFGSRAMRVKTRAHVNELLEAKILEAAAAAQAQREAERALLQASLASRDAELESLHQLLQGEKDQNAEVIRALQRETDDREAAMRAKDSLLEAEREHREALAQRLEEAKDLHQQERSALEAELLSKREELATVLHQAEKDRVEAALRHAEELRQLREETDAEQARAVHEVDVQRIAALQQVAEAQDQIEALAAEVLQTQQQAWETATAAAKRHTDEVKRLKEEYTVKIQKTVQSAASDLQAAIERHAEAMSAAAAHHQATLEAAAAEAAAALKVEQAAVADLHTTLAASKAEEARLRTVLEGTEDELARTTVQVKDLLAHSANLLEENSAAADKASLQERRIQELEDMVRDRDAGITELQTALAGMERAHAHLLQIHFHAARRSRAARVIQRAFRAARVRALMQDAWLRKQELAHAALREGRLEGETAVLQGEKAALQVQQKQFLAWSGQAMVANSINVMEEAVEQIRAAFLLPQKDLRLLENAKRNMSLTPNGGAVTPRSSPSSWSIRSFSVASMRRPSFSPATLAPHSSTVQPPKMEETLSCDDMDDAENRSMVNCRPGDSRLIKAWAKSPLAKPSPLRRTGPAFSSKPDMF